LKFPKGYTPGVSTLKLARAAAFSERLWPLANEGVANRFFEEIEELEQALVERCVALYNQPELIRSYTCYHWWPQAA
jgi:hypothetical protein